jgi:NADH-ubiquinone oxidoreductase chain 1
MTEHAAVIFVFFFLAEYGSILLMCILTSILFLGGYLLDLSLLMYLIQLVDYDSSLMNQFEVFSSPLIEGLISGLTLGIKSCVMVFVFI